MFCTGFLLYYEDWPNIIKCKSCIYCAFLDKRNIGVTDLISLDFLFAQLSPSCMCVFTNTVSVTVRS